jgi:glycosyltransferase involved in cell wall biosynthesis
MQNNNQPLVSIMLPVFNGEKTLQIALASLKIQTYGNWKAIIVNDGSTDGTKEILDSLEGERYKVIHLPKNKGRGNARQVALDNAEGKYLAFLDADDFYHPKKLEHQVKILEKHEHVEVVSTGIGSFDLNKNLKSIRGVLGSNKIQKLNKNCLEHPFSPASCMLRINKSKKVNYNLKLNVGEDNDFLRRYFEQKLFYKINEVLYYYEEVGAINFKKLLNYQFESVKTLFIIKDISWLVRIKEVFNRMFKILYYMVSVPISGIDTIITKRGKEPTNEQVIVFNEVKTNLNIN